MECLEGKMPTRYDFSLAVNKNEVYIFGGFNEDHKVIEGLTKLELLHEEKPELNLCIDCLTPSQTTQREIAIMGGFLHGLALELAFPFKAI